MYDVIQIEGINYARIPKNLARKYYNKGFTVYGCTNKMRLNNIMCAYFSTDGYKGDFDKLVNEFEYYNCSYECGYYTHFYVDILA